MFPLEFPGEVNQEETRLMGLSFSEDRMLVAGVVLHDTSECQTVRHYLPQLIQCSA